MRVQKVFEGKNAVSRTQQQFKDEQNINNIVSRYKRTGVLSSGINGQPRVPLDMSAMSKSDFYEQQVLLANVKSQFNMLPADVRARFSNDVGLALEFMADESEDAVRLSVELGMRSEEVLIPFDEARAKADDEAAQAALDAQNNTDGGSATS